MEFLSKMGLDFLVENEENFIALTNFVMNDKKAYFGYYGLPYFYKRMGWPEVLIRTDIDQENKAINLVGFDTHLSGVTQWTFQLQHFNIAPSNQDKLSRRVAIRKLDGSGLAVVNLVTADLLPSFLPDDVITAQMVGFPFEINYYKDEEEYNIKNTFKKDEMDLTLKIGSVFPSGLLYNHKIDPDDENKVIEKKDDDFIDCYTQITGIVKSIQPGISSFGDKTFHSFIDVVISTEFGDLEIVHTEDDITDEERDLLKVGSVVSGVFYLSGDVCIKEYTNGIVKNELNNLAAFRQALENNEFDRLRSILTEDTIYVSDGNPDKVFKGIDEIIERFKYVHDAHESENCSTKFATVDTIIDFESDSTINRALSEHCILIMYGENHKNVGALFIDLDDDNNIKRIEVTYDKKYNYKFWNPYEGVIRAMSNEYIGTCTECGEEDVKVTIIDDVTTLCEDCIEDLDYIKCDNCEEYWLSDVIEFSSLKDGRIICEHCLNDMLADEEITEEDLDV